MLLKFSKNHMFFLLFQCLTGWALFSMAQNHLSLLTSSFSVLLVIASAYLVQNWTLDERSSLSNSMSNHLDHRAKCFRFSSFSNSWHRLMSELLYQNLSSFRCTVFKRSVFLFWPSCCFTSHSHSRLGNLTSDISTEK